MTARGLAPQSQRVEALRVAGVALWCAAALAAVYGGLLGAPWAVGLAAGFVSLAFVAGDASWRRWTAITPATMYALSAAATGFANAVGLHSADTPKRDEYFLYTVEEHVELAVWLALAGAVLPVLGFRWLNRPAWRAVLRPLPDVDARFADRPLVLGGTLLALAAIAMQVLAPAIPRGTVTSVFFLLPQLVVFVLARLGEARGIAVATRAALLIAILEATRQALFEYLRHGVAAPFAAFTFGVVLGSRSFAPLRRRSFIPVYAAMATFLIYFGAMGAVRQRGTVGVERLQEVLEYREDMLEAQAIGIPRRDQSFFSRLTSFNQLSQIGRVVEEDGFLRGQTLDYLGFAFIPRFLWPGKPLIAKGSWFALRIGQAEMDARTGRITNAVNMTVQGELYLNFGWAGVGIGCLLFGAVVAAFWIKTNFWRDSRNALGSMLGFYLLWIWLASLQGSDLQILVTMLALYLLLAGASVGLALIRAAPRPRRRLPEPASATP